MPFEKRSYKDQEAEIILSKVKLPRYTPWRHMGGEEV
jgi:hypothetical protein